MKKARKSYVFWIILSEAVGIVAGVLTMEGMQDFSQKAIKPGFYPPPILFPIVWTILYALMGFGMARVQRLGSIPESARAGNLFISQLIVNFFWPLVFFNAKAYGLSLVFLALLWLLTLEMIDAFRRVDRLVGNLQLPYLLWLSFAALLNEQIWQLN